MALQCNVTLNTGTMSAGQSPPPQATLTVYNANASAVVVTGAQVFTTTLAGQYTSTSSPPLVPLGSGATTLVPALSSITFGPFPIVMASAANANPQAVINPSGNINPVNPQPAERPFQTFNVGALVYGSDGSINTAGTAALLVGYTSVPPIGFQGGPLQFGMPNNLALGLLTGVL
jgi:hypothetical protein